tara:strand:- start:27 stop:425 length:399 start_codon:yes stop_codon:yes gene_type:complete
MKQILFILLFPIGLFAQEWDVYRIKAIQNGDTTIVSVSNTIEVPKTQLIYIPTVFSPDGDGTNDLFYVKGQNIGHLCLEVYNRWGQEVFSAPTLGDRWDGTYRGQACPMGTYVYRLLWDKKTIKTGTITLIR